MVENEEALITSCYGVALHAYNDTPSSVSWRTCSLRKWLNSDFLSSAFSPREQEMIHTIVVAENDGDISFSEEEDATDQVFILSEAETERYFGKPSDRMLLYNERLSGTWSFGKGFMTTCRWWMRGKVGEFNGISCAPVCDHDGSFGGFQAVNSPRMAVRPALWVDTATLRPAALQGIEHLNIRLKKGDLGTLTFFTDGFEDQREVLARFVDYETLEEYVMYQEPFGMLTPLIARVNLDHKVDESIERKAEILHSLLSRNNYDDAADLLMKKKDERRVRTWMQQMAWFPSPGECLDVHEGDVIHFGKMSPGEGKREQPIPWIVLRRSGNKALLVTKNGVKNSTFMDDDSEERMWEHSWIRTWLNTEFYKTCFTKEEKRRIQDCITDRGDRLGRVNEDAKVIDHVFLLNDAEASLFFSSDAARVISGTPNDVPYLLSRKDDNTADWWWLRSPGDMSEYGCCVDPDGHVDRHGCWVHSTVCAIRPAILIDLRMNDSVSGI